jgi:hypothetical protein
MKVRRLLAVALSVVVLTSACGDDDTGEFSEDFRRLFMQNCSEDESEAFCGCYLDELEKRFTQDEIIALAIEGSEEPPPEFFEAGFACAQYLDG